MMRWRCGARGKAFTTGVTEEHRGSTSQFAEEFLLVHAVLEGFAAVDEDDGNFVVVEVAECGVGINVHLAPGEAAVFVELDEGLLDDLAKVASPAGIHDHFARLGHGKGSVAVPRQGFQGTACEKPN